MTTEIKCAYKELVPISELKPHPKNRNKHPSDQITRLAEIISFQGIRSPIKVSTRSGFITAGHGRLEALRHLRIKDAPVDYQDYDSDEQEYADLQADNAIALWAELDLSGINMDVPDLGPDFDINMMGIRDFTLEPAEKFPQCDEDEVPDHVEPKTNLGDIYQLGEHRLMCGNSTVATDIEKLTEGQKAEMCFTDPPYGVNYSGGIQFKDGEAQKNNRKKLANDDSTNIYSEVAPMISAFVHGPCYIWFAFSKAKETIDAIDAIGEFHALIIWNKTNATYGALNANYKQRHEPCVYLKTKGSTLRWAGPTTECTVWDMKRDGRNDLHPTQKPVELAARAIGNHDAKTVLDLFGGSGSTLIACENTSRKCFMMELDPHYCDVIVTRWEKYTGKTAELTNGQT